MHATGLPAAPRPRTKVPRPTPDSAEAEIRELAVRVRHRLAVDPQLARERANRRQPGAGREPSAVDGAAQVLHHLPRHGRRAPTALERDDHGRTMPPVIGPVNQANPCLEKAELSGQVRLHLEQGSTPEKSALPRSVRPLASRTVVSVRWYMWTGT